MTILKKFKTFFTKGKNSNIEYWKISTTNEEIIEIALNKMKNEYNCDIRKNDLYQRYFSGIKPKFKNKLYIIKENTKKPNMVSWYFGTKYYRIKNYKFMGKIKVTNLDKENFRLKKETDKYNL